MEAKANQVQEFADEVDFVDVKEKSKLVSNQRYYYIVTLYNNGRRTKGTNETRQTANL